MMSILGSVRLPDTAPHGGMKKTRPTSATRNVLMKGEHSITEKSSGAALCRPELIVEGAGKAWDH